MSKHRFSKYFLIIFLLGDLICLNIGIISAALYQFNSFDYPAQYATLHVFLNLMWLLIFFSTRLQEIHRHSQLLDHLNRVLSALVINLSIVFALWFALEPVDYSRKFLFVSYFVFSLSVIFWRSIWHYFIRHSRAKGYNTRNVLVVGTGDLTDMLIEHFKENPELGYKLTGVLDDKHNVDGSIDELEEYALKYNADIIFCHLPNLTEKRIKEIIDFAENNLIKVNLISQFSRLITRNLSIEQYGNIPIINVNTIPLDHEINRIVKRVFDVIFSSLVLLSILSWLIPIMGILVKLDSKGPIFFKQKRHGKDNEDFLCWKFRTMTFQKNARFEQAKKNDNRVTKIGTILRKTSIDELPQFINVFLGDMSVVGPRPHPIALNEEFQPQIDRFWQRHAVKPGITGLAQAKGFRGETAELSEMSGRIKLDRFYVKNWSLTLDVKIILLTAISIIRGNQKAY